MKFSRRHYEALAVVFKLALDNNPTAAEEATIQSVIKRVADKLTEDNPAFNRSRFMKACGLNPNDIHVL